MLYCSRRGVDNCRRHPGSAVLGDHNPGNTCSLRGTEQGADILGILQVIEHQHGSWYLQQILERRESVRFRFERDTLVIGAARRVVEHEPGNALDLRTPLGRQCHQTAQPLIFARALGDEQAIETPPPPQRFEHRISPEQQLATGPRQHRRGRRWRAFFPSPRPLRRSSLRTS